MGNVARVINYRQLGKFGEYSEVQLWLLDRSGV